MLRWSIALVLATLAAAPAASAQTTLFGSMQGGAIALRDGGGITVAQVGPGTYSFQVSDADTIHNFDLVGTSVVTPIEGTGTFNFPNVALATGSYRYQCDVHPDIYGTLTVGSPGPPPPPPPPPPQPPPPTAPATVTRVAVTKARGIRTVAVTLRVTAYASARAQLLRRGRALASVGSTLSPGSRTVRVRVARRVSAGPATLRLGLKDLANGRNWVVTRAVRLPRP